MRWHQSSGYSLIELLVVAAVGAILVSMAVPALLTGVAQSRTLGAARYLAARMQSVRAQAVATGRYAAVRIVVRGHDLRIAAFKDGNRNGIRAVDVASGVDAPLGSDIGLGDLFRGIAAGGADGSTPPPVAGERVTWFSFAPTGTASSGTVYLRGGSDVQYAVRVLGATGRVRLLRFRPATGTWVDVR